MRPTERIILSLRAWHSAAKLLRERCGRLQAGLSTWRRMCDGRAICGTCYDMLSEMPEHLGGWEREWVPREAWMQARTWAARWKAAAHHNRRRKMSLTMRWVHNVKGRVRAECEAEQSALSRSAWRSAAQLLRRRLQDQQRRAISLAACANRIQADSNRLADQLHAWRQACQDHGIQPTPEALRAVLRRVDAGCVAGADL